MAKLYRPNEYGSEGLDHINISSQSSTHLGKLLDPSYFKSINYPHLGKFSSVLNLWYWLKDGALDDRLRNRTGARLKNMVAQSDGQRKVSNFRAIIAQATYIKLMDYPAVIREIKALPADVEFVSYYTPKGSAIRLCSSYAPVVVTIAGTIKKAVDADETPDFLSLCDAQSDPELFHLEPFLSSLIGSERVAALKSKTTADPWA